MIAFKNRISLWKRIKNQKYLLALLLPGLIYYIILHWGPMFGMIIAFERFDFASGIFGSPWVGLKYFREFINSPFFVRVVVNTVVLCVYQLVASFPLPILFALLLNEIYNIHFKKIVQIVSYLPHFISIVIVVGLLKQMLSPTSGIVNQIITAMGGSPINFFIEKDWFRSLYVWSGVWQTFGWGAILYISAIVSIDPQLYESANIDGGGRFTGMWHITIPGILPTIVIVFLLNLGNMLNIGFEKILMMYNPATYQTSDVISTFVYRTGLTNGNYSLGAAAGMMNAVVSLTLVIVSNRIARKLTGTSLW